MFTMLSYYILTEIVYYSIIKLHALLFAVIYGLIRLPV